MQKLLPFLAVRRQLLARSSLKGFVSAVAEGDVSVVLHDADQGLGCLVVTELAEGTGRGDAHVQRLLFLQVGAFCRRLTNDPGQQLNRRRVARFAERRQRLAADDRGRVRREDAGVVERITQALYPPRVLEV